MANFVKAPLPGTVLSVNATAGQQVNAGDTVLVLEAMKMENDICAEISGTIGTILVNAGDSVSAGQDLVEIL